VITEEDYSVIAEEVYRVDLRKTTSPPLTRGGKFATLVDGVKKQEFYVYDSATDPVSGFQAMAAVPIVGGKPDFSHVYVAFAGTNPDDRADITADFVTVYGGRTGLGTQLHEAEKFVDGLEARLKEDGHAGARMEAVGHSLGGFEAMWIAAERHWPATTFNAPDPWQALSPQGKDWIREQRELGNRPMTNWVNQFDLIGNAFGHKTGAAVLVKDAPGKVPLDYHNLATGFHFEEGILLNAGGRVLTVEEIATAMDVVSPGHARALRIIDGVASALADKSAPVLGAVLSGVIVAVDTAGAGGLAASIGGLAVHLQTIKEVNGNLIPSMNAALANSKTAAAQLYPWITEADVETCVRKHDLHVERRIDEHVVAAVDNLVDDHIATVLKISDGVNNVVKNAVAQDVQWARAHADLVR
jgi:hypothetical protein